MVYQRQVSNICFKSEDSEKHVCSPASCPDPGSYYVTAVDGPWFWKMSGPYTTHAQALAMVDECLKIANDHDARAWFMSWGTARMADSVTEPGNLNKAGLIHLLDERA